MRVQLQFHEIFIDFCVHFASQTQIQFPSSICLSPSHLVPSSGAHGRASQQRTANVCLCAPAKVAICNNLPLLPTGNCMQKHFPTGMAWNIALSPLQLHIVQPNQRKLFRINTAVFMHTGQVRITMNYYFSRNTSVLRCFRAGEMGLGAQRQSYTTKSTRSLDLTHF